MGEIAEMMLDGILDMHTGEYIGEGCGYPRSLDDDYSVHSKKIGVTSFLSKKGCESKKERREILERFHGGDCQGISNEKLCIYASDNFKQFIQFFNKMKGGSK